MTWYVEYYDEEGYWYLDSGFNTAEDANEYYKNIMKPDYELVAIFLEEVKL